VKTPERRDPQSGMECGNSKSDSSYDEYFAESTGLTRGRTAQNNIFSRLRQRTSETPVKPKNSKFEIRKTRSMGKGFSHKNGQKSSKGKVGLKKRDQKFDDKAASDFESCYSEESKVVDRNKSIRTLFLSTFGSVYQEYDDFLQKRKRNRKAEFIKLDRAPGEEIIKPSKRKNIMKIAANKHQANQDTF
jgi:hypothetical protein